MRRYSNEKMCSKYFDLESFKLNCGEFLPGQRYGEMYARGTSNGLCIKEIHRI